MVDISAMVGVAFELLAVRVVTVSSATTVILTVAWAGSYLTSFAVSPAKIAVIVYSPVSAIAFSTEQLPSAAVVVVSKRRDAIVGICCRESNCCSTDCCS